MPHKRSVEGQKGRDERQRRYFSNLITQEQNRPRYTVTPTFTVKQHHIVAVTDDTSLVMTHQRRAVGLCVHCGSTENLHVHHIDKNHGNNSLNNLLVLCASCHKKEHLEMEKKCLIAIKEAKKLP